MGAGREMRLQEREEKGFMDHIRLTCLHCLDVFDVYKLAGSILYFSLQLRPSLFFVSHPQTIACRPYSCLLYLKYL